VAYKRLFTSESVTEGHPDKLADQISDAVLDALIKDDPYSRVAVETFAITGQIHIAGEVTTKTYVDIPRLAREVVREVGYTRSAIGFDAETCGVSVSIDEQSPDIAMGVDRSWEARSGDDAEFERIGAGDQGMMFGYACRETEELMPLPIVLAHNLTRHLSAVRKSGDIPYLRPDGKSQVTIEYDGDRPVRVEAVVLSTQHDPEIPLEEIRREIRERVIDHVIPKTMFDEHTHVYVNPTGRFVIGGPKGDAGLTGRKIIADTYGGMARHGGGAFSGKDPTKVDRSAAYAARWVAKNVVAAGLADRCEVQVAYAIGVAHPVSVLVETFGTGKLPDEEIAAAVLSVFDLRPAAIIHHLDLRRPIYQQTAAYGHFGRPDLDLPWEHVDRAEALRTATSFSGEQLRVPNFAH
jgi:S-adenosylmethionine synthetase